MLGLLYLVIIFLACMAFIVVIKLAVFGFKNLKKKEAPPPPPPEKKEKKPEPVYYIVEKKRAKKSYSTPKEIEFK